MRKTRCFALAGGVLILYLFSSCISYDYNVTEAVQPAYTGITPEAALTITDAHATWYQRQTLTNRAQVPNSAREEQFTSVGPEEPIVFVQGQQVSVVLFQVRSGEETTITPLLVTFDLNRHLASHTSAPRVFSTNSATVSRKIEIHDDLTAEDISPIVSGIEAPAGSISPKVYIIEDLRGERYRKLQVIAPDESLYLHLETGDQSNTLAHHWFAGRFESSEATIAAIAREEIRVAVQDAEAERQIAAVASTDEEAEPPQRQQPLQVQVEETEVDADETVTIAIDGGTFTGEVDGGKPNGQGQIQYDDGRSYEGGFQDGLFHGRGVLTGADGSRLEAEFNGGVPDGDGRFEFAGEAYDVRYQDGGRVDARYLEEVLPNLERGNQLRAEISEKVRQGYPESAYSSELSEMQELTDQLNGNTGPERLLFEFQIDDQNVRFQVNDDGLVVSRFEELRIEGEDGELLGIQRAGDTLAITDAGAAVRIQREELERLREPVTEARFLTLVGGGGIGFGSGTFLGGATIGIDYRFMNNRGEQLPGAEGGSGKGWDFRGVGDMEIDYQSYDGDSNLKVAAAGGVSAGRTNYTFDPMDQETLEQSGSGRTFGVQLLFSYEFIRPEVPDYYPDILKRRLRVIPAPFFSFESYQYSPGSTELSSRTTEVQLLLGGVLGIFVSTTLTSF